METRTTLRVLDIDYTIEEMKEFVEENTDYIQRRRAALCKRFPQGGRI